MEPKELPSVWGKPDLSRLTAKQISIRLPLEVSAKIAALNDLFPKKTKTEIIGDLLASALGQARMVPSLCDIAILATTFSR